MDDSGMRRPHPAQQVNNPPLLAGYSGRHGQRSGGGGHCLWAGVLPEMEQPSDDHHLGDGHAVGGGELGGRDPFCRRPIHPSTPSHPLCLLALLQGECMLHLLDPRPAGITM